jgi:hypothetical protein
MVLLALPTALRALHLGAGTLVWAALIVLVHRVARASWPDPAVKRASFEGVTATT